MTLQLSSTLALNLAKCMESHPEHACTERSKVIVSICLLVWQSDKIENHAEQETYSFEGRHKGHKQQA